MNIYAFLFFIFSWLFLEFIIDHSYLRYKSLSYFMAKQRILWMSSMAKRDIRMIDTQILIGQQNAATFFGSASILAIGATFGMLGATDAVLEIYQDFEFFSNISRQSWEIQVECVVN